MGTTKININIDKDLKDDAQRVFDSLQIDMSTAIRMYLAQVVRDQAIPFNPNLHSPNEIARGEALAGDTIKFEDFDDFKRYIDGL